MPEVAADLLERFRAFRAAATAHAPAPPAAEPRRALPPGGWEEVPTPRGAVPVRTERRGLAQGGSLRGAWPERLAGCPLGPPEGWRWIDLETTGLCGGSGTRAFLVGIGRLEGAELLVRQYLLTELDREAALLEAVGDDLAGATAVVSFNGKAFDLPLLRDRCLLCAVEGPAPALAHWDVLHAARRLWSVALAGRCDLRRLQSEVLGELRRGDVAGALIPALYTAWLDGEAGALDAVCRHHREDLFALAGVAGRLCALAEAGPAAAGDPPVLWGLGRLYERAREPAAAAAAYRAAHDAGMREAGAAAAQLLRRLGRHAEAVAIWERERTARVPSLDAAVELAKYLEHRRGDPGAALAVVREALRWATLAGPERRAALEHRERRLRRKLEARPRPLPAADAGPGGPPGAAPPGLADPPDPVPLSP